MSKEYYQENRAKLLSDANARYKEKREEILEYKRQYYQKKRQEKVDYARKRRAENPDYWKSRDSEKHALGSRRWRLSHPVEARLLKQKRRAKTRGVKIVKEDIPNWQSRICGICDIYIEGAFHIDHKYPLARGGKHEVSNLQLAHPLCNLKKHAKIVV